MKTISRALFYASAALFWLLAVIACLELYTVFRWHSIEHKNRFVLAYNQESSVWPRVDIDENGRAQLEQARDLQTPEDFTPTFDANPEEHLGTLFASLDEADRATYAFLRDMVIAVYDRDGNAQGFYATPETAWALRFRLSDITGKPFAASPMAVGAQDGLRLIQRVFDTGKPDAAAYTAAMPFGSATLEMACYPMRDADGTVRSVAATWRNITGLSLTESLARTQQANDSPMWKTPWFEYRKNAHLSKRWFTNNAGFRDDDVTMPKPPAVFRIACVGGSTTEEGITNDTTYPNVVEKKLRTCFNEQPPIEVINCGVGGIDSLGERKRALDFARLQPDLVVEHNAGNDLCHGILPMWEGEAPKWRKALRRSRFLERYCNAWLWPGEREMRNIVHRKMIENLDIMRAVFTQRHIAMAVCSFAYPDPAAFSAEERDYFEYNTRTFWQGRYFTFGTYCKLVDLYNEEVRAFCKREGAIYIPLAEELKGGIEYFGDICHLRPKGIERKAEIIAQHLKAYLEPRLQPK